jgi:hypothetical protein
VLRPVNPWLPPGMYALSLARFAANLTGRARELVLARAHASSGGCWMAEQQHLQAQQHHLQQLRRVCGLAAKLQMLWALASGSQFLISAAPCPLPLPFCVVQRQTRQQSVPCSSSWPRKCPCQCPRLHQPRPPRRQQRRPPRAARRCRARRAMGGCRCLACRWVPRRCRQPWGLPRLRQAALRP